jgi:hypothetical protein
VRTERRYEVRPGLAVVGLGCLPLIGGIPLTMAGLAALATGDEVVGIAVTGIGLALIAIPLYYAFLEPHEIRILEGGTIIFAKPLLPGRRVSATDISRLEWITRRRPPARAASRAYDDAYALHVYHSGGRVVLPRIPEERDFVYQLQRLNPDIEVATRSQQDKARWS